MNNFFTEKLKLLKLFVWDNFCPDYSPGVAFAIAESEQQAKEMIVKHFQSAPKNKGWDAQITIESIPWGEVKTYKLTDKVAFAMEGCS
jgi:hypothetical protein